MILSDDSLPSGQRRIRQSEAQLSSRPSQEKIAAAQSNFARHQRDRPPMAAVRPRPLLLRCPASCSGQRKPQPSAHLSLDVWLPNYVIDRTTGTIGKFEHWCSCPSVQRGVSGLPSTSLGHRTNIFRCINTPLGQHGHFRSESTRGASFNFTNGAVRLQ